MYFYIIFIILSFFVFIPKRKNSNLAFLISITFVVVFSFAIKSEAYGLDIITYFNIFIDPSYHPLDEPGLNLFNLALKSFSSEYFLFSVAYSFLLTTLCSYLYWKLDRRVVLFSFLILISNFIFFQMQLNIYRQGVATLLVLISFLFYRKSSLLSFFIIILACFFHKAAMFGFLIIFISRFPVRGYFLLCTLIFSVIPFGDYLFIFAGELLANTVPILSKSLTEYVRLSTEGIINRSDFDHRNLPVIITLFAMWYWKPPLNSLGQYGRVFLWCYILSIIFASLFSSNVLIYDRIIIYAQILQPVFFSEIIYLKFKQNKIILYSLFVAQLTFTLFIWGPRNFVPEISFLLLY